MLDVHPPHQAAHTWKDFFIHIATICIGLLIAIGLEQSVEFIHHRHQRHELLDQLEAEHRQTLKDAQDTIANEAMIVNFYSARIGALNDVLLQHRPYQAPPRPPIGRFNDPEDPVWRAAKASGLTSLLPQQAVVANSETEQLLDQIVADIGELTHPSQTLTLACGHLPLKPGTLQPDYDHADSRDLRDCLAATMTFYSAYRNLYIRVSYLIGAEKAILAGETDIDRINDKEYDEKDARQATLHPTPIPQ